ncbi:MAG: 23S rRNA (adenine(2030)-N(6))-methyltransferase RlmJ [Alphaproteobacteria bacterium]|nr:23S rRNA (adenine(2030)-N(6))-methyltransferase RlmJ [Alphaproteobacteria bacterium]
MNYRHAYHAGNFADVLKHVLLCLVISHLKRKDKPFRVIDTHAGAGLYELDSVEASKTGEWREGIGRLLACQIPSDIAPILTPYLDVVRRIGCGAEQSAGPAISRYPGSPLIAAHLLRNCDRLIANELHGDDREALEANLAAFGHTRRLGAKVMGLDGYVALKSTLPPKERRGVILIDPPFEQPGELQRLINGLREGVRRFSTGTFMLWYPIKDPGPVAAFKRQLGSLGLAKLMAVELLVRRPDNIERLNGHGLIVLNPPFTLRTDMETALPFLGSVLGQGEGASFRIEELPDDRR